MAHNLTDEQTTALYAIKTWSNGLPESWREDSHIGLDGVRHFAKSNVTRRTLASLERLGLVRSRISDDPLYVGQKVYQAV